MEKRIFISHSSKDSETATIICDALESNGMKCWIAPRDIPYGKEWAGEISKAIMNSSAFLFLSSGNSNQSGQVSREIQLAIENQVPIIPIRLDGSEYSDTNKYYLATIHCMFQYDASRVAKLVSDIEKAVPKTEEQKEEEKRKKKEDNPKKDRYGLKLTFSVIWCWLCAVAAAYLAVFSDFASAIKIVGAVAAVIIGFIPLFVFRKKALKAFKINKTTAGGILALALVGVIGIGAGSVALENYIWYSDLEYKYHITLTAPDNMTAAEFKFASETVKNRLDIVADGQRYSYKAEGDAVDLIIPFEIFGELTATDMLKCYVSRAARLYLTTTDYADEAPDPAVVEVTPADVESVQLLKGKVPGEPEVDEKDVQDVNNYEYIEIVLKKDFYKANKKALEAYGDRIVFAQDKVEISDAYYYFDTFKGEKDGVYYIVNNDRHPTLNEVLVNNITNEHPSASLNVNIDVAADWEKRDEGAAFGKNQVEYKEMDGETVSVSFRGSEYSNITEGSWLDTVASFKKRLDCFGEPYALGYGINDPYLIVVRMSPDKLNNGILTTLCAADVAFIAGYTEARVPVSYSKDKYVELTEKDGTPVITVKALNDNDKVLYGKLREAAELAGKDEIYLAERTERTPLLRAGLTEEDGFTFTCLEDKEDNSSWLPALTLAVYEHKLDVYLTLESYSFSEKDREFSNVFLDEQTRKAIEDTYSVRFIEEIGGNLRIGFDFSVDENLPQNMITASKKLYELIDFENSSYDQVSLYFINEQGEERARVFFAKHFEYIYSTDDFKTGYPYLYGIFTGGRIERDHQAFLELVAEDEFFQGLNKSDEGRLFFD